MTKRARLGPCSEIFLAMGNEFVMSKLSISCLVNPENVSEYVGASGGATGGRKQKANLRVLSTLKTRRKEMPSSLKNNKDPVI